MEEVIIVDKNDQELGTKEKLKAHLGNGILHRAFVAFIFNSKGELLIQKRSEGKMLWPLYWDNSCSSHPKKGESYKEAGERRLKEELGFSCDLEEVDTFIYQEKFKDVGSENELCKILIGEYNGLVEANLTEITESKWILPKELSKDIKKSPNEFTPWFKIALKRLIEKGKIK